MSIEVKAIYEGGVLRPDRPLPLEEHQRVTVVVQDASPTQLPGYGIIGFQGDPSLVRKVALESEFGIADSP